jgi:hypothetical protein
MMKALAYILLERIDITKLDTLIIIYFRVNLFLSLLIKKEALLGY